MVKVTWSVTQFSDLEGDFEWPLDLQFSDMWIPDIKTSIENNEYRWGPFLMIFRNSNWFIFDELKNENNK